MKTFQEFVKEAYLSEMRKEDKVKGRTKTPLAIDRTRTYSTPGYARKAPEGSGRNWDITPAKKETHTDKVINPEVSRGRFRQGGERGGNNRPSHFSYPFFSCLNAWLAILHESVDVFHHHNTIVHQHTQSKDERKEHH